MRERICVGFDFGTSTSEVALCTGKVRRVLPDARGDRVVGSIVGFLPTGDLLIGNAARMRCVIDPQNTIHSFKRIIGLPAIASEVAQFRSAYPFQIERGSDGRPRFITRAGAKSPEELATAIFTYLMGVDEVRGAEINAATVTVPNSFRPAQSQAVLAAARAAGLRTIGVLDEAYAAALPYVDGSATQRHVVVYDLGGGTFDAAVLRMRGVACQRLAHGGDAALGGNDIDLAIARMMAAQLLSEHNVDVWAERVTFARLVMACERAKRELCEAESTHIELGAVHPVLLGKSAVLTRAAVEERSRALVDRTFVILDDVLRSAGMRPRQIDTVILSGGSAMLPMVRSMVATYFGKTPTCEHPPDEVVALGASMAAALQAGDPGVLTQSPRG